MRIFASWGDCLGVAVNVAERLFKEQGAIKLLTGHKSKGLEFENVFLLDPSLVRQDDQDLNLKYVMQTRSEKNLFSINTQDIAFE
jgi:ATP-dependent exoDNAse (exonuclease V) beta subunit